MTQEIKYLLAIITTATNNTNINTTSNINSRTNTSGPSSLMINRVIDLTPALHLSIEIISSIIYQYLKQSLSTENLLEPSLTNPSKSTRSPSLRVITRTEVMRNPSHWMYGPVKEIIQVALRKYPHITIGMMI